MFKGEFYVSQNFFRGGGKRITDATLLPENAPAGEIFYNNNGRQVGTNTSIKMFTISDTMPNINEPQIGNTYITRIGTFSRGDYTLYSGSQSASIGYQKSFYAQNLNRFIGFKLNGQFCFVTHGNNTSFCVCIGTASDPEGYIYVNLSNWTIGLQTKKTIYGMPIEIYYI